MTSEDLRSELDKRPFGTLRIHLVSGKTVDVTSPDGAWMLQNAVMITTRLQVGAQTYGDYRVVALRNIELLERLYDTTEVKRDA